METARVALFIALHHLATLRRRLKIRVHSADQGVDLVEEPDFPNFPSVPVLWDSSLEDPTPFGRGLNFSASGNSRHPQASVTLQRIL